MANRYAATHRATVEKPAVKPADPQSVGEKPRKFIAGYMNPACKHEWARLDDELQTLAAEGKIIWKCGNCSEITNTYDWQTP